MNAPKLPPIPGINETGAEPHFFEPWQAKAFALTLALHEAGHFDWADWAEALGARLHGQTALPDAATSAEHAAHYFTAWLATLEEMTARSGLTDPAGITEATETWQRAARATPHGTPIRFEAGLAES